MSDGQKFKRFGRYLILDHLQDGGMSKICRARFLGEQADKIVAIKMILPQFSKDASFKQMFMDEIKLTFGLLHPNIVQTYDYGEHRNHLYVALELCDGRNLKEYLDKLKQRKFVFPVEISVYIITQVCQGLHYAHTLTDKLTGKAANIIHRDISPHNIMLTYDGAIKVIDFGIAKAETNSEHTQAGTIKGKLSYLAPEYLDGLELDPRYDEFAVGITLWEMLCSRKLFKASNDLAILKKIQECKIPAPSSINPNVPKELDEIVLKALHKDRSKRYENLDQLNRALIKFLYATYPDFNATDLSYFAKELFKEEIKKDREKLFEFGKIDLAPFLDDLKREQQGQGSDNDSEEKSSEKSSSEDDKRKKEVHTFDFGFEDELTELGGIGESGGSQAENNAGEKTIIEQMEENENSVQDGLKLTGKGPSAKEARAKAAGARQGMPRNAGSADAPPARSRVPSKRPTRQNDKSKSTSIRTKTRSSSVRARTKATRTRSEMKSEAGSKKTLLYAIIIAGLAFFGWQTYQEQKTKNIALNEPDQSSTRTPAGEKNRKPKIEKIELELEKVDKYNHKVYVDGIAKEVGLFNKIKVPVKKEFILRVEIKGQEHFVKKLYFSGDGNHKVEIPNTPRATFGFVTTSRKCLVGKIYFSLFNEERVENIPIQKPIPFPVNFNTKSQEHTIFFQLAGEEVQKKIIFVVNEDKFVDLCDYL